MSTPQIMTKEEIHNFGIEMVLNYIKKDGYEIESINDTIGTNPQIIATKDNHLVFIAVRTECYPKKGELEKDIHNLMIENAAKHNATPYFASVGIANSDAKNDKDMSIAIKGTGFHIAFEGLLIISTSDNVKIIK